MTVAPVELPRIRRKVLGDQLVDRLVAMPGNPVVAVYRGEVTARGRRPQVSGSVDPPLAGGTNPGVAPYVVVFGGTGSSDLEVGLERCGEQLRWTPGTTIAAASSEDCEQTVDRVCAWLKDWRPVLPGVSAGFLLPPPGFDPAPARPDTSVQPSRFFVPLQWRLDLTT